MSHKLPTLMKSSVVEESEATNEKLITVQNFIYTGILLVIIGLIINTYILVKGTPRESHLMEWLNIIVRVMHITFGIAWIGASFYFVFLENAK